MQTKLKRQSVFIQKFVAWGNMISNFNHNEEQDEELEKLKEFRAYFFSPRQEPGTKNLW